MKRQRVKNGDVLAVPLGDKFALCVFNEGVLIAFDQLFDSAEVPEVFPCKFCVALYVFDSDVRSGVWPKIGRFTAPIPVLPQYFKRDPLNGSYSIYDPYTGVETASSANKCEGMEELAVWHREVFEDRLRSALVTREKSKWLNHLPWNPLPLVASNDGTLSYSGGGERAGHA